MNPKKYYNLIRAQEAGCLVPDVLLVTERHIQAEDYREVTAFLEKHSGESFIVRSAAWGEDTTAYANAGYFYSSNATPADHVVTEIKYAYLENRTRADALGKGTHVDLMLMPFMTARVGGVVFCPWLYFHEHSLVAYADTPQQAVAGVSTTEEIIAHGQHASRPAGSTFPYADMLGAEIRKLRQVFKEAIDVEWCLCNDVIYILQVRPITIAPTSLKTVPATTYISDVSEVVKDEYAQELGKLSPLSVALLNTLYKDAKMYCQAVRIKGGEPFLTRLKNGEVMTLANARAQFFSNERPWSAFSRAFNKQSVLDTLDAEEAAWETPAVVSYDAILRAFTNWHIAQTLETLAKTDRLVPMYPGEYELSHVAENQNYGNGSRTARWKQRFMESLRPLKVIVRDNPLLAWCTLSEVLARTPNLERAQALYEAELPESIYMATYVPAASADCHVSGPSYTGSVKIIATPEMWRGPLPRNAIIATTHIPSSWIPELQHLAGIAVTTLSPLSHAAIVLRERNIPSRVLSEHTFAKLQDGTTFTI